MPLLPPPQSAPCNLLHPIYSNAIIAADKLHDPAAVMLHAAVCHSTHTAVTSHQDTRNWAALCAMIMSKPRREKSRILCIIATFEMNDRQASIFETRYILKCVCHKCLIAIFLKTSV